MKAFTKLNSYLLSRLFVTALVVATLLIVIPAHVAFAAQPSISVTGNNVAVADVNNGTPTYSTSNLTNFGSTKTSSVANNFVISNSTAGTTLAITSITSSNTEFAVSNVPASVTGGGTASFTVTFTPNTANAMGARTTLITISNSSNGTTATYTFGIQATWALDVQGNSVSITSGSTSVSTGNNTDFGNTNTGVAVTKQFTLRNGTASAISISSIASSNSSEFAISGAPSSVAANSTATFNVVFTPAGTTGARTSTITINNGLTSAYTFAVQGTDALDVQGNSISISSGDTTPSTTDNTDFGSTNTNTPVGPRTFTLRNGTASAISISSIASSNSSEFAISGAPSSVAANSTATFNLTFTPNATGLRSATITINNGLTSAYTFAVQGTGITPVIGVKGNNVSIASGNTPTTADNTDYGSTNTSTSVGPRTFTINNTGTGPLTISGITNGNTTDFTLSGLPTFPATVAAGGSTTFQVTFNPTTTGVKSAAITIANNSSPTSYVVNLQGTGTTPSIAVTGNSNAIADGSNTPSTSNHTDFGGHAVGESLARTYTINNSGSGPLTISSITSSNNSEFAVSGVPSSVAAGSSATFQVTFSPSTTGVRTATITINNNTTGATNPYTFAVQGKGPESNDTTSQLPKTRVGTPSYTSDSSGTATPGTWTVTYNFLNSTGKPLRNIYYSVTGATNATLTNSGASGGGGVGTTLTVPNSALPGSNEWPAATTLTNQQFKIHVTSTGWSLTFVIYAVDNTPLNSLREVGAFTISSDDVAGNATTPTHTVFMPLVQR